VKDGENLRSGPFGPFVVFKRLIFSREDLEGRGSSGRDSSLGYFVSLEVT